MDPDDPRTLTAMYTLGRLYTQMGNAGEAETYHRMAMEGRRRRLGDEHHDTITSMEALARVLRKKERLHDAAELLESATRASRAALPEHQLTAMVEHHYAEVLVALGNPGEAIDLAQVAVDRYRAHPEWPRGEAAHACRVLAAALSDDGRSGEALPVRWEHVEIQRSRVKPAQLASMLSSFALEASGLGDPAWQNGAAGAAREALDIRQSLFPDDHAGAWLRHDAMGTLGEVLVRQAADPSMPAEDSLESLREAESLLVESGEWLVQNSDRVPERYRAERVRAALVRLVELYETWDTIAPDSGKAEQAARWQAELDELPRP
jgi:tetratricopeptide (TPR) repeat protein